MATAAEELTFAKEVKEYTLQDRTLLIRPKVVLQDMFDQLGRVTLDHASNKGQRNRPDRSQLTIILLQEIVQLGAMDAGEEGHMAEKGDCTLRGLKVWAVTGTDSMRTVLVEKDGRYG